MLPPGTQLGRFEIQRKLGRGGMGTVYVAHDPVLGRLVAIKLFQNDLDLADAAQRFTTEARSAAALNHANIVTIYDFGDYDFRPYLAMEYVQGETLADIIKRKATVSVIDKLRWLEGLCAGVSYAHRMGVVHRDIKPSNLMVDRSGRLKILDFGIAKILGAFTSSATALVGTPGYMAPEQITGGPIDHRVDIFAVGVVAYELLAYTEAFAGENTHAITYKILSQDTEPLAALVPELHPELVAGVERALKKAPGERFGSADELLTVIDRIRRKLEAESSAMSAPTVLAPRPSSGAWPVRTGAQTRPAFDAAPAGALTPPPAVGPTDRAGLTARRSAQIEAALERSRAALHRGDLEIAADECLQARTLDETHIGAIELEAVIKIAVAKQRAIALVGEARQELTRGALTGAQQLLVQARELDPDATDLRKVERDLRLARAEQERLRQRAEAVRTALDAADNALSRGDVEVALGLARQALELEPDHEKGLAIEAATLRALDISPGLEPATTVIGSGPAVPMPLSAPAVAAPTVIVPPSSAPFGRITPAAERPTTGSPRTQWAEERFARYAGSARALVATGLATWRAMPARRQKRLMAISAGVALLVVVVAVVALLPAAPPPAGAVLIDAVPFATVTGIERADGTRVDLPPIASTPLSMTLPAGTYRARLIGPAPASQSRLVTFEVQPDGVTASPVEHFTPLTPDEYFEQYLSSPVEGPSAETQPGGDVAEGVTP